MIKAEIRKDSKGRFEVVGPSGRSYGRYKKLATAERRVDQLASSTLPRKTVKA